MIDTDKYTGYTEGEWLPHKQDHHGEIMIKVSEDDGLRTGTYWKTIGQMRTTADKLLAADAPLLLEEVKRLRKGIIDFANKWKHNYSTKELLEMIE